MTLLLMGIAGRVQAQSADSARIAVRIVDSAGAAIREAEVMIRDASGATYAAALTDETGRALLTVARTVAMPQLAARHVGFRAYATPIRSLARDTLIAVVMADLVVPLDPVNVRSREALRRQIYYIDSATIAHSKRPVFDGWDIVRKLRPDIAYGRGNCPGVQNVWINGKWMPAEFAVVSDLVMAREPQASAATPHINANRSPRPRAATMSMLAGIKPEHIAEMTYRDCRDKPTLGAHSVNAVFVILNEGIGFDPAVGSFVIKH